MSGIDEEHEPGMSRVQRGPQLVAEKSRLIGRAFRETCFGGTECEGRGAAATSVPDT